ncbi:MAG: HAMP domain-containing histidine kinase [Lachnospiraceae bacterium]|nr:HAMP domain-containing histidine kinase [Lachnospiraceae bacterium]
MINRLKKKFLIAATISMFVLMSVLVVIMNTVNYFGIVSESDEVLDVIATPGAPFFDEEKPPAPRDMDRFLPRGMSMEVPFESRFFIVDLSPSGEVLHSDLTRIISVDEEVAQSYIAQAVNDPSERGFIGQFRYVKIKDDHGSRLIFLDCGRRLDSFRLFRLISVTTGLAGCLIAFLAFFLTAGKIVSPIAESYEKQKRFISDAGHEIKTPLTIINANVDLLESDGEKEELTDIRTQTKRLTELTGSLIMLSKMEESASAIRKIDMPVSDLVSETAATFRALASAKELTYDVSVKPDLTINASPDAIRQLLTILLDNAMKYASRGGNVSLDLHVHKRSLILTVANSTQDTIDPADLAHVFDRFYRSDASRNSTTGGHGIGLSIAKAIVSAHAGRITASTKSGHDFTVTVTLPL